MPRSGGSCGGDLGFLQGGDDVADVVVELEPQALCARVHLVAMHTGGKRRLLQLLLDRLRLEPLEALRPYQRDSVDEAGELVAREERLLQRRVARNRQVL